MRSIFLPCLTAGTFVGLCQTTFHSEVEKKNNLLTCRELEIFYLQDAVHEFFKLTKLLIRSSDRYTLYLLIILFGCLQADRMVDELYVKTAYMIVHPQRMPKRVVVYAKDVENITGRRERAARKILQRIREKFGKPTNGFVTVREFSLYTGIDEDLVREFLID